MLLQQGAGATINQRCRGGTLPVEHAIAFNCLASVKMMLDADSVLDLPKDNHLPFLNPLQLAIKESTDDIIECMIDVLVDRRCRLRDLAISTLSPHHVARLGISTTDMEILDGQAYDVVAALEQRNVNIPAVIKPPWHKRTVFHIIELTPTQYESLYARGFHDVDTFCSDGLTPLMCLESTLIMSLKQFLQRVLWLISKGADLDREPQYIFRAPGTTAIHSISSWIGASIWDTLVYLKHKGILSEKLEFDCKIFDRLEALEEDCRLFIRQTFSRETYDGCLCACSAHGCAPATMMLKTPTNFNRGAEINPTYSIGRLWLIESIYYHMGAQFRVWPWLSREIIRVETFERLELTHTCCEGSSVFDWVPYCIDQDIEEIQEEEHFLIDRLDTLVTEFHEKYIELGVPIPEFLKGYWESRMEEIENEDVLDDEDIARIRDLGVAIHEL